MSELIKREDAINAVAELQGIAQSKAELTGISKAWKRIKALPTVDAVQVTRCVNCKHSTQVNGMFGLVWCDNWGVDGTWVDNDFYCADGERRTNG